MVADVVIYDHIDKRNMILYISTHLYKYNETFRCCTQALQQVFRIILYSAWIGLKTQKAPLIRLMLNRYL